MVAASEKPKSPPALVLALCRALVDLTGYRSTLYWLSIDRARARLGVSMEKLDRAVAYAAKAGLIMTDSKIEPHSLAVTYEGRVLSAPAKKSPPVKAVSKKSAPSHGK